MIAVAVKREDAMDYGEVVQLTSGIVSGVKETEGLLLYQLLADTHRPAVGTVDEIGAYTGKSTIILAATGAVDHHRGNAELQLGQPRCRLGTVIHGRVDTCPLFEANVQRGTLAKRTPIITDRLTDLAHLREQIYPISVVFVDAEHSYETTVSIIQT